MTAPSTPVAPVGPLVPTADAAPSDDAQTAAARRRVPSHGWRVIAAKELGDHILSVRFIVLFVLLGIAAVIPLYFAADQIRALAPSVSGASAVFLALFRIGSDQIAGLQVDTFVGIVAPLLGLAFAFDAVNGERSEGTLPRLVAQPIYRDDVINGKFAGGLAAIGIVLVAVILIIAAFGILRLGLVPHSQEVIRLAVWVGVTFLYVALWLSFGLLLSVVFRRAATSALIGFGVWAIVVFFGGLIVSFAQGLVAANANDSVDQQLQAAQLQNLIRHVLPSELYADLSTVLLNPGATASTVSVPGTVGQVDQAQQQIPTLLSLDQSLLLVWPQVVALVALTVICFAAAYITFMRQEVRA
jgi:ABC-2 type transport system permease protein